MIQMMHTANNKIIAEPLEQLDAAGLSIILSCHRQHEWNGGWIFWVEGWMDRRMDSRVA
jgi:hypothetical protein